MSREKIIQTAAAENGTTETPANSNRTKYGEWYGLNGVAWCAIFVSWVFEKAGHPLGKIESVNGYQSCQGGYQHWKNTNELTSHPEPGDIVLYDWNGDGHCDHTGIFCKWVKEGISFQAWEGNTSNSDDSNGGMVMLRNRSVNSVRAFVSPLVLGGSVAHLIHHDLSNGDRGAAVVDLQKLIHELGYQITVDGFFGNETEEVVKHYQELNKFAASGIASDALMGFMKDELNNPRVSDKKLTTGSFLRKGDFGFAVVCLQKKLNEFGANPKIKEDGIFGNETAEAVEEFQVLSQLLPDGIAGPETFHKLNLNSV